MRPEDEWSLKDVRTLPSHQPAAEWRAFSREEFTVLLLGVYPMERQWTSRCPILVVFPARYDPSPVPSGKGRIPPPPAHRRPVLWPGGGVGLLAYLARR